MRPEDGERREDPRARRSGGLGRRLLVLTVVVAHFGVALGIGTAVTRPALAVLDVGEPGTVSRLLLSVVGLQVAGFGTAAALFFRVRDVAWRSYVRLGPLTERAVFRGTAVALSLMVLTAVATVVLRSAGLESPESPVGVLKGPLHYLALGVISTVLAVPMEELFFRGVVQRRLEDEFHDGTAVAVASVLFASIHTGPNLTSAGALLWAGLYVSFGVVLGVSYTRTENLSVPLVGHALFNGIQILVRALEVAG